MKTNYSILTLAISSLLIGCSDSDSSSGEPAPETFTLSGVVLDDTYKANTEVCIDFEGLEETCNSSYSTMTDENGKFYLELNIEEKERLENAKITANIPSANSLFSLSNQTTTNSNTESISYQSLVIGTDGQDIIVSPFTTHVVNEIALDTTNEVNEASFNKATKSVVSKQNLDNSEYVFADYLLANDQDVIEVAKVAKYDFEKAKKIEQEILADISNNPDSPYTGWDTLNVIVSTFWQHSPHNHEFTQRVEHLVYTTRTNKQGLIEDRKEGIQWYVDEYQDGSGLPLQNWNEERTWLTENTVQVYAFWEFDYDQDGFFKFKGEKGAEYTYVENNSQFEQYSGYETYNEGNPAEEGAQDRGDREWVENCPINDELNKIGTGDILDTCVDFVEFREINTADINKGLQTTDIMTEWQAPIGTPVEVRPDNQDYYEERTQVWMDDGAESNTTKHDWNAVHYHNPELPHAEPFNEILVEGFETNGDDFSDHSTPYWNNILNTANDFSLRGIREYNQINTFRWMDTSDVFIKERVTEHTDGSINYSSSTLRLQDGYPQLYYADSSGKPEVWSESEINWDEESLVLDAKIKTYDNDNLTLDPVVQHYTLNNFSLIGTINFADLNINGHLPSTTRPAFTSDIYNESTSWNVNVESEDLELKQVAEFIFKVGQDFSFEKYNQSYDMSMHPLGQCENSRYEGGVQNVMQFEKGGDMYVSLRCEEWWVAHTYKLEVTSVNAATGSFTATLKQWEYGVNVLYSAPVATATLTFQPLN